MMNLTQKILASHLVSGQLIPGEEISIRIDQTLTQDSTGTMAYLQFEAMGVERVRTKRSVAYIDHNTLQTGFENADDHQYIQTVAHKHGIWCSKPGNGICHQVHLERYGIPGWTLLGSDSHTPTGGGIGMLAIGAGGLDVAVAMGGGAYYLTCPRVVNVHLTGKLPYGVAAKDIILEVLRRLSVKGGVGRVMEYTGPGVATLTVPERATIANMGAELGATTSVFPSDEVTRAFLKAQDREADWQPLAADPGAAYDETVEICLDTLVPLVAKPHMPDNVEAVEAVGPIAVDQVFIGSCTNSSYQDMMRVARILKGKRVHPNVSLVIGPGSRQVLTMLARNGALADMMAAGARILDKKHRHIPKHTPSPKCDRPQNRKKELSRRWDSSFWVFLGLFWAFLGRFWAFSGRSEVIRGPFGVLFSPIRGQQGVEGEVHNPLVGPEEPLPDGALLLEAAPLEQVGRPVVDGQRVGLDAADADGAEQVGAAGPHRG